MTKFKTESSDVYSFAEATLSKKTQVAVLKLDKTIGKFLKGLKKRKIGKEVNIIGSTENLMELH